MLNWYALYTKSRHEKFIDTELGKRGTESFLPLRRIRRRWSDRTITLEEPLFKSYIFVKTDPARRTDVLKIKGAVSFVKAGQHPVPVEEKVVLALKSIIQNEIQADPFPYIDKGDLICIKSGPFKGLEGYVVLKDNKRCRMIVSIVAIRSSVAIEIDSHLVEKAN